MRQSITIRLDRDVLAAAKIKSSGDNRTLTNYIETLVRRDLQMKVMDSKITIIAPEDIRNSIAVPFPGETEENRNRRDDIFFAVLEAGSY